MYEMKVNGVGRYAVNGLIERVKTALLFPELKEEKKQWQCKSCRSSRAQDNVCQGQNYNEDNLF